MPPLRFQHAPWYVKVWRLRWYLTIPFMAVRIWVSEEADDLPFFAAWSIAVGCAQLRMEWWYTSDEVFKGREVK